MMPQHIQLAHPFHIRSILPPPGPAGQQDDYVAAVTALFRDIAVAVEENEAFLRDNFGTASVIDVVMGLQVGTCKALVAGWISLHSRGKIVCRSRIHLADGLLQLTRNLPLLCRPQCLKENSFTQSLQHV